MNAVFLSFADRNEDEYKNNQMGDCKAGLVPDLCAFCFTSNQKRCGMNEYEKCKACDSFIKLPSFVLTQLLQESSSTCCCLASGLQFCVMKI